MAWDWTSFLVGGVVGFVFGAIVFTQTGREVSSATGKRIAHHVKPKE